MTARRLDEGRTERRRRAEPGRVSWLERRDEAEREAFVVGQALAEAERAAGDPAHVGRLFDRLQRAGVARAGDRSVVEHALADRYGDGWAAKALAPSGPAAPTVAERRHGERFVQAWSNGPDARLPRRPATPGARGAVRRWTGEAPREALPWTGQVTPQPRSAEPLDATASEVGAALRARPPLRGGRPLPPPVRERLEAVFGEGLGHVRVHVDTVAQETARQHGAAALAAGADVLFGTGRFAPQTASGFALLAHEVAHTLQMRGAGPVDWAARGAHAGLEQQADLAARSAALGRPFRVSPAGGPAQVHCAGSHDGARLPTKDEKRRIDEALWGRSEDKEKPAPWDGAASQEEYEERRAELAKALVDALVEEIDRRAEVDCKGVEERPALELRDVADIANAARSAVINHFRNALGGVALTPRRVAIRNRDFQVDDEESRNVFDITSMEERMKGGFAKDAISPLLETLEALLYSNEGCVKAMKAHRFPLYVSEESDAEAHGWLWGGDVLASEAVTGRKDAIETITLHSFAGEASPVTGHIMADRSYGKTGDKHVPGSAAARRKRWKLWKTLVHETIHTLEHPACIDFRDNSNKVIHEGFCEMFTKDVIDGVLPDHADGIRGDVEGSDDPLDEDVDVTGGAYTITPEYAAYVTSARRIRSIVGDNAAMAAFFLGHVEYLGFDAETKGELTAELEDADLVTVPVACETVQQLSELLDVPVESLRTANPELVEPIEAGTRIHAPGCREHVVVGAEDRADKAPASESLTQIAEQHERPLEALVRCNPGHGPKEQLKAGARVLIPGDGRVVKNLEGLKEIVSTKGEDATELGLKYLANLLPGDLENLMAVIYATPELSKAFHEQLSILQTLDLGPGGAPPVKHNVHPRQMLLSGLKRQKDRLQGGQTLATWWRLAKLLILNMPIHVGSRVSQEWLRQRDLNRVFYPERTEFEPTGRWENTGDTSSKGLPPLDLAEVFAKHINAKGKLELDHALGRTLILKLAGSEDPARLCVKVAKAGEPTIELSKQADMQRVMLSLAEPLGLRSVTPTPCCVGTMKLEGLVDAIGNVKLDLETAPVFRVFVYRIASEDYLGYLNRTSDLASPKKETTDTPEGAQALIHQFDESSGSALHDLFVMAGEGWLFTQLIDLFHGSGSASERLDGRPEDGGRFTVLANLLRSRAGLVGRTGGMGRVDGVKGAVEYPNWRKSGLADEGDSRDFEHVASRLRALIEALRKAKIDKDEQHEEWAWNDPEVKKAAAALGLGYTSDTMDDRAWSETHHLKNIVNLGDQAPGSVEGLVMSAYLGEYLFSWLLTAATFYTNDPNLRAALLKEVQAEGPGAIDEKHPALLALAGSLQRGFVEASSAYTGLDPKTVATQIGAFIDFELMAKEIAFWMTEAYVRHFEDEEGPGPEELGFYPKGAKVSGTDRMIDPDDNKNWVEGKGFVQHQDEESDNTDLGAYNGQMPLKQFEQAIYRLLPYLLLMKKRSGRDGARSSSAPAPIALTLGGGKGALLRPPEEYKLWPGMDDDRSGRFRPVWVAADGRCLYASILSAALNHPDGTVRNNAQLALVGHNVPLAVVHPDPIVLAGAADQLKHETSRLMGAHFGGHVDAILAQLGRLKATGWSHCDPGLAGELQRIAVKAEMEGVDKIETLLASCQDPVLAPTLAETITEVCTAYATAVAHRSHWGGPLERMIVAERVLNLPVVIHEADLPPDMAGPVPGPDGHALRILYRHGHYWELREAEAMGIAPDEHEESGPKSELEITIELKGEETVGKELAEVVGATFGTREKAIHAWREERGTGLDLPAAGELLVYCAEVLSRRGTPKKDK